MSIQVYIGHSGQRLILDPNVTSTVEALRSWIAQQTGIKTREQILLTSQGKQVRTQTLLTENELFVFDSSRLTGPSPSNSGLASSVESDFSPGTPPDSISNQNDMEAWQNLFRARKSWASGVLNGCAEKAKQADRCLDERSIIERSLGVAVASLMQHVKSAEQKYQSAEQWAEEMLQEQHAHVDNWEQNLDSLRNIPARAEFAQFVLASNGSSKRLSQQSSVLTLQGFVDVASVKKAASAVKAMMSEFSDRVASMQKELDAVVRASDDLRRSVENINNHSVGSTPEPQQLLNEIRLVANKISSDLAHVQSLPRTIQSLSQASKMALLHTRTYLPRLSEHSSEMNELARRTWQERERAADLAQNHMRTLSSIESQLAQIYADIKALELPEDDQNAFATLNVVSRLPSVYGQLLIESVRRREWVAKMKRDSTTLQEEVATYQEEEDKRRKKWIRSVDDVVNVDALQSHVLGIELSLRNEGGSWPMVTREALNDYLGILVDIYGPGPLTEEMEQGIKDLDKPTRKQIKHAKAFKNGSMHEAVFGDTSLLLRGDEQQRTLREANIRLEDDLRAQKSREKKLARRVVELEAKLQAQREEAASRKTSDAETQKQVEEALSTKRDLMENMEAQQREFANERRTLERELAEARERIEDFENELDRLLGSRDDEIARLKEDAMGHAARAATEQDARTAFERKLNIAEAARVHAEEALRQIQESRKKQQEAEVEQLQLFTSAHNHLMPNVEAPNGLAALAVTLEELVRKSAAHIKDLEEAVAFAKSENESLSLNNERLKHEIAIAAQKQSESEENLRYAQNSIAAEQAKAESLEQQLLDEQQQLRELRTKFADGETGSEVLRQRIVEEEARAAKLSSQLAEANVHINRMDIELTRLQKKHHAYHASAEASARRLEQRAERARDVSQKLYSHNARLIRLLERLGLAVSYSDDGTMIVERASKMGASTSDASGLLNRTTSTTSPPPTYKFSTVLEESPLPALVRWPDAQTADEEAAQYESFMQQISRFSIDTFTEAVHKRLRDFEYTAKKYNKEAKESAKRAEAYKERSAKLKSETHAKIAVKDFKEGDLALFLPTRGQAKGAWAAFNIGCPHYFLAEKDGMRLGNRDFIVARINKIEQRVVDLSRSLPSHTDGKSIDDASDAPSVEDENPFNLSDGLTWWMVHATEERGAGGAPSTPGLGKSTVAAANVDAKGSIRIKRNSKSDDASKHLNKSLDSRRSSSASKKGAVGAILPTKANIPGSPTMAQPQDITSLRNRSESQTSLRHPATVAAAGKSGLGIADHSAQLQGEQVRKDLLWGP
ncbi:hypothetical protein M433DRAFT_67007 [Acidomyces richmondensis BFW]|nr:MAG: hypothetical protein FE78DRAFT_148011 [Acidomyces sp. 'richmondensis']KYG45582.1 hypothetical protein M433DRAFT_67007 [Acidomyces richmondensis BFW]